MNLFTSNSPASPASNILSARNVRTPLVLLLTLLLLATSAPRWAAASTGASFTAGGVVVDGDRYAKQGDLLTLEVTTPAADCVRLIEAGVEVARQATSGSQSAKTSWTFSLQGGAGDGLKAVSVTAHSNRGCGTNQQIAQYSASYALDNTKPTLTGTLQPANLGDNGWYRDNVTVVWTCSDAGSGIAPGACPDPSTVTGEGSSLVAIASVSDRVGNQQTTTVTPVKLDRTAPTTTADVPDGWRSTGVDVTLTATDNLSGIAGTWYRVVERGEEPGAFQMYTGPIPVLNEGIYAVEFYSRDGAGNVEQAKSATVMIDMTAPTIDSVKSPVPNAAGWNKGAQVGVTFECDDLASGIDECLGHEVVTNEVRNYPVVGTAVDNAGNDNQATAHVFLDRTRPTVSALVNGEAGVADWYTDEVTVAFTCADPLSNNVASGIVACPLPQVFQEDGEDHSTTEVSVFDLADNESVPLTVSGINIDTVAPVTTATLDPETQWAKGPVEVTLDADDVTSGVETTFYSLDGDDFGEYDGPFTVEDEGGTTVSFYSVDVAGNIEQAQSVAVQIDQTAPTTTVASVTPNVEWANGAVTVLLDAQDEVGGSGVATTYVQVGGGESQVYDEAGIVLSAEGVHALRFWSVDVAGNIEDDSDNTLTIRIDDTDPVLTGTPQATNLGDNGWYRGDATVVWTCSDALSGIDEDCPPPTVVEGEGDDLSASQTVYDRAGNSTTTVVPLKIDRTAPFVEITSPAHGATTNAASVTVEGSAADAVSGLNEVTVNGTLVEVTQDGEFELSGVDLECGTNTITAVAEDIAGHTSQATAAVTRQCSSVTRVQSPLAQSSAGNIKPNDVKRGRVVPVKVEIESQGQAYQVSTSLQGNPTIKVRELPECASSDGSGIEVSESAGNANSGVEFRWTSEGHWIYNLATDKMTVGKCYRIDVEVGGHRASNDRWAVVKVNR